jgi:putative membrane protein
MAGERVDTVRDHLANKRTLLAWIRTAITIMGLGFVIARLEVVQGREADPTATAAGTALVVLGGLAALAAGLRFARSSSTAARFPQGSSSSSAQ